MAGVRLAGTGAPLFLCRDASKIFCEIFKTGIDRALHVC